MVTYLLGDLLKVQSTSRADNLLLVDLNSRERGDLGTSSDDDVLGLDLGLAALSEGNVEAGGRRKGSGTLDVVDTVLLEQVGLDTTSQCLDRSSLGSQHGGKVELDTLD